MMKERKNQHKEGKTEGLTVRRKEEKEQGHKEGTGVGLNVEMT